MKNNPIKNLFILLIIPLLFSVISGCVGGVGNYNSGIKYGNNHQYETGIDEFKKALELSSNKTVIFGSYINIGLYSFFLGNRSDAYENWTKAAEVWPERAYYPYANLSDLEYLKGDFKEAEKYIDKAYNLVNSNDYYILEKASRYEADTPKRMVIAKYNFIKMILLYDELKQKNIQKNYNEAALIAKKILNQDYLVDIGIGNFSTSVDFVIPGSIADINGIVQGDQLLEIDGKIIKDFGSANDAITSLYNKFGSKINIRIMRKNREMTISCYLYYPELEQTKKILSDVNVELSRQGNSQVIIEDKEPPEILILEPKVTRGIKIISKKDIEFTILASDTFKVEKVFVNDKICEAIQPSYLDKNLLDGNVMKFSTRLSISAAEQAFTIKAIDSSGNISTKTLDIRYSPEIAKYDDVMYRNKVAVVIGIDKYKQWPTLECAVADANAIKKKFSNMGFDRVFELCNNDATRLNILRLLSDKLPNILGDNDQLVIYFAGHGQTETYTDESGLDAQEGYIIPVDGDKTNYRGTAISMSKIIDISSKLKAKHVFYVFDSCYSGLGLKRSGGIEKADGYIKKVTSLKSVQIVTAGGKDELAGEEKGHGIFTRYFLMALDGKADFDSDGYITGGEIGTFLRPAVSKKTNNAQTPKFGWIMGEGDNVFINN